MSYVVSYDCPLWHHITSKTSLRPELWLWRYTTVTFTSAWKVLAFADARFGRQTRFRQSAFSLLSLINGQKRELVREEDYPLSLLWSSSKKVFTARINHWPSCRHVSITVARVAPLHWHFQRRGRKAECLPVRMKSLHACQLARDEHLSTKLRLPNTSRISTSAAMHEAAFNVMIHQEATKITQWLSLVN